MTNHVHLVAVPARPDSFAAALRRSHSRYSQTLNRRYGRSGHLWQNRFFSCPLGPDHLLAALAYVDQNPVRAGLAGRAEQYPWSSAAAHLNGESANGLLGMELWRSAPGTQDWRDVLSQTLPASQQNRIRSATYAGLPCGGREFISDLESQFGRRLTLGRPGRKGKNARGAAASAPSSGSGPGRTRGGDARSWVSGNGIGFLRKYIVYFHHRG